MAKPDTKLPIFLPITNAVTPELAGSNREKKTFRQKYILQTRNDQGHIVSLGTFERVISPEEAVQQFGPRDYTLKAISPRFRVEWKHKQPISRESNNNQDVGLQAELEKLNRKTKLNTYAIVGLGIATVAGFGLSHWRFSTGETRIAQLEAVARTINAGNLQCPNCSNRLAYMLQRFCSNCRALLTWPETLPAVSSTTAAANCTKCGSTVQYSDNFCHFCGGTHTSDQSTTAPRFWATVVVSRFANEKKAKEEIPTVYDGRTKRDRR